MTDILTWIIVSIIAIGAHTGTPLPPSPVITIESPTSTTIQIATSTTIVPHTATSSKSKKPIIKFVQPKPVENPLDVPKPSLPTPVQTAPAPQAPATPNTGTPLSNDNYYTNSSGNTVHDPAYSTDNSIPVGASALCRDGTYSFSQHRSGTCSHHGGVARWL